MSATGRNEVFSIACDLKSHRARIAMAGSDGAQILIAFNFRADSETLTPEMKEAIYSEGEIRLRHALLQLIANGWPAHE